MNTNDLDLDRKSDPVEIEPQTKPRVSDFDCYGEGIDGVGGKSVNFADSRSDFVDDGEKVRASVDPSDRDTSVVDYSSNLDGERELRIVGSGDNGFSGRNNGAEGLGDEIVVKNGKADDLGSKNGKGSVEVGKSYDSMLSMFDEFAAGGKVESVAVGPSKAVGYGYEIGDMVWGKVKSHPWWPGQIYSEEFASPSVRRSKREGHVLVAFFGDSSYGWFDADEIIPFDSNYEEKSRQIASKPFLKAVEEAVDELSRRRGMGLACRCRNAYNFRATNVEGYFAVDVGDYDPGAVYSTTQIKKARDSFQPREALDFIKKVALSPKSVNHGCIDFIKNKATVLAYRKAVFEEYDETYAQAFGYEPVRPSPRPLQENAPGKISSRAPLSGRLVIAESLGKGKSSAKSPKVKDHAKKDKYLFKRRDEPKELKVRPKKERQQTPTIQPVYIEGSSATTAGEYVLQKRAPEVSAKSEQPETPSHSGDLAGKDISILDKPSASLHKNLDVQMTSSKIGSHVSSPGGEAPPGYSIHKIEMNSTPDMGKGVKLKSESDASLGSGKMVSSKEGIHSSGDDKAVEGFEKTSSSLATTEMHGGSQLKDGPNESESKKVKVRKRPAGETSSGKKVFVEKKKRKKDLTSSDIPHMRVKDESSVEKKKRKKDLMSSDIPHMGVKDEGSVVGKKELMSSGEKFQAGHQSTEVRATTSETIRVGNIDLDLPQVLSYLQILALDPYYGSDRGIPSLVAQVCLKYRSLVYQKSLALSQLVEDETNEVFPSKSSSKDIREVPPLKRPPQPRPSVRLDDPTKGGRKRGPSDRQEEIAVKKKKKVNDIKSLTTEKKVIIQKTPEELRAETRPGVASSSVTKKFGQESIKKMERTPPPRALVPTMLVMKFPPGGNIPSVNELKAKFFRFGPDLSATRSFWKTMTCRVVFKDRKNADAAYQFCKNNRIFEEAKVYLRDVAVETETDKVQKEDLSTSAGGPRHSPIGMQQQPKSILKKSAGGEEAPGIGNGGGRGSPRVKFMLGGEESNMKNNFNNYGDTSSSSTTTTTTTTSHARMDFNSKNFQKVNLTPHMLSPLPPLLPLPISNASSISTSHGQSARPQNIIHFSTELVTPKQQQLPLPPPPPRNAYNTPVFVPPQSVPNVDIAPQMLSLLIKCNDVVNNVRNLFGYVPYHPL